MLEQILRPLNNEINQAASKANSDPKKKCSVAYLSVKFIVDSKTFECDTVIFSKSIIGKLDLDPDVFKNFKVNWAALLDSAVCGTSGKFEIVQPVRFHKGDCKYPKLSEYQLW